jgi:hypothetical protein
MLTDEDKSAIAEYVAQQIEARSGAARVAFEMVVEAVPEAAEQDLRPVFRDALKNAADAIRKQSEDQGDMLDLMADELEAYVQQIEDEEQGEDGSEGQG